MIEYLKDSIPVLVLIIGWAIRQEIQIAKIQTDLTWIKKKGFRCPPTSENHTP